MHLKKIVDKYKGYIFAIILNFINDHNEAENIAQEVFFTDLYFPSRI